MNRQPVTSTDIASVGYDEPSRTLEIEFVRNARIYQYDNVKPEIYQALMRATSKGAFFFTAIKNGGYTYREIKP